MARRGYTSIKNNVGCVMTKMMPMFVTAGGSIETTSDNTAAGGDSLEKNPLILTGVGLCVLVVLVSIAFVCHRQWRSRKLASKLSLTSTPAHEALLSRTEQTDNTTKRSTAAAVHDPHK